MGVVTLVNIKILTSSNTFNFFTFFFSFGSIGAFVLFFYLMSMFSIFPEVFQIFTIVFIHPLCYIAIFFVAGACILIDNGLNLAHFEIKIMLEHQEKDRKTRLDYLIKNDNAIQRRRITSLNRIYYDILNII